jgi:hypothetical protein
MNSTPILTISTDDCKFSAKDRALYTTRDRIGSMPSRLYVESPSTGRKILFKTIGPDHPKFDEDGWDGMQNIYEPVEHLPKVDLLYVFSEISHNDL